LKNSENKTVKERFTAALGYDGLVLGLSYFSLLHHLPQKRMLASKVVKTDSKINTLVHC